MRRMWRLQGTNHLHEWIPIFIDKKLLNHVITDLCGGHREKQWIPRRNTLKNRAQRANNINSEQPANSLVSYEWNKSCSVINTGIIRNWSHVFIFSIFKYTYHVFTKCPLRTRCKFFFDASQITAALITGRGSNSSYIGPFMIHGLHNVTR